MDYSEFKENIVAALQDFYGKNASVIVNEVLLINSGKKCDGINILFADSDNKISPIIYLNNFYPQFAEGTMSMEDCTKAIIDLREKNECSEKEKLCAMAMMNWDVIKDSVYPILISTERNQELLDGLVTDTLLDLSVVYIIRFMIEENEFGNIKINKSLFEHYGVTKEELHEQALCNLKNDGYRLRDMDEVIGHFFTPEDKVEPKMESSNFTLMEPGKMYVLTNASMLYGAAGILDKSFLQKISGGMDFLILPSSVHETIILPVDEKIDGEEFDNMVAEVNATQVNTEEQLANHSYYYDAQAGEIRFCV